MPLFETQWLHFNTKHSVQALTPLLKYGYEKALVPHFDPFEFSRMCDHHRLGANERESHKPQHDPSEDSPLRLQRISF